jgi:uncharacterized ferritin-like protein (DUF455 family)
VQNPLLIAGAREKISAMKQACQAVLAGAPLNVPELPGRDIEVVSIIATRARSKPGLSTREGQGRLVHDLASIELQAMELAFRSLIEFPRAPTEFREELSLLALSEAQHFEMCLDALDGLDVKWGEWGVHLSLWSAAAKDDSILDRLIIVHRYLEGGGLDAGVKLQKKLNGVNSPTVVNVVNTIVREEIGHVSFGSEWYRRFCEDEKIDARQDFGERLNRLMPRIPRRLEKIDWAIRKQAGFTDHELEILEGIQIHKPWSPVS